ncbi:MAG: sugar transferase [Rhodospirillales bacterium]|nr:sugar transferase [Rhodospirillales bacterium]
MLRIFRHYVPYPTIAVSAVEVAFLFFSFYLYHARAASMREFDVFNFYISLGFSLLLFTIMFSLGLYNRSIFTKHREMLIRIVLSFFLAFPVFVATISMVSRMAGETTISNGSYLPGTLFGLFAIAGTRLLVLPMINVGALKRRVLVLGVGDLARRIEQLVMKNANRGFVVVDYIRFGDEPTRLGSGNIGPANLSERRLKDGATIAQIADDNLVDEIVIATRDRRGLPIDDLLDCKLKGINIIEYLTFWERETGRIDLEALQPSWLFFSDGFRLSWFPNILKRLFDVAASGIFVVLTSPVMLATAIAIRLEGPGPIFYVQERVGLNGRPFLLKKFRSMMVDAETDGPRWAAANDQRITRVGTLIRKTRIDEIPQIFNVLRGDMSFIGPRPERPFFVETLVKEIPYYNERHRVKPGISGWAQVNFMYTASVEDAQEKLTYDLYYVKNWSLFLDFLILLQTARVVLWPEGVR